jgi:hypothetical protein
MRCPICDIEFIGLRPFDGQPGFFERGCLVLCTECSGLGMLADGPAVKAITLEALFALGAPVVAGLTERQRSAQQPERP